jgi:hypothetical protein
MGEISKQDEFGQAIISTVQKYKLQTILEIGSWDGTGSTQCFIEGLKNITNPKLFCIELREDRFEMLKQNTKEYPWVTCINSSTISENSFIYKSYNEIENSPYNKINNPDKNLVKTWFEEDMKLVKMYKTGYLDTDNLFYDGVLIDGGEFFGYSEYLLLKDRTNVFFLDDYYNAFKTHQVARELSINPDWEIITGNKFIKNGYAIFKRKQFI